MTVIATSSKDHPISIHQDGLVGFKWTDSPSWEKQHIDTKILYSCHLFGLRSIVDSVLVFINCVVHQYVRGFQTSHTWVQQLMGFAISPCIDSQQCLKSSLTFVIIVQDVWSLPKLGIRNVLVSIPLDSWQGIFANAWDYIASRLGLAVFNHTQLHFTAKQTAYLNNTLEGSGSSKELNRFSAL